MYTADCPIFLKQSWRLVECIGTTLVLVVDEELLRLAMLALGAMMRRLCELYKKPAVTGLEKQNGDSMQVEQKHDVFYEMARAWNCQELPRLPCWSADARCCNAGRTSDLVDRSAD